MAKKTIEAGFVGVDLPGVGPVMAAVLPNEHDGTIMQCPVDYPMYRVAPAPMGMEAPKYGEWVTWGTVTNENGVRIWRPLD